MGRIQSKQGPVQKKCGAPPYTIYRPTEFTRHAQSRGLTVVQVSKQGCVSITSWQHLTCHFMTPARHTESFSYYYFNYFRHVALLQKFAVPLVGAAPFLCFEHAEHA